MLRQKVLFTTTYARALHLSGDFNKSLSIMKSLYPKSKKSDVQFLEYYSLILAENGEVDASSQIITKLFLVDYRTSELDNQFKKNYILSNGNDFGFKKYLNTIDEKIKQKQISGLKKRFLNIQSTDFKLKDLNNKYISLSELKGKVVIIDFWSTWCVPCRDMFPAMQKVIDKYKNNSLVEFLFVATWENDKNYKDLIKKYIAESDYSFKVLYDEIDQSGKQQKIANLYNISSLPTRIIIDKNGVVKLKEEGFSGSAKGLFNELSTIIDYLLEQRNY